MLIITGFLVPAFVNNVSIEYGSFNKQVREAILYLFTFNDSKKLTASG